jgi:asparagine synthase (glutamine-hydrolysing)
MSGIGGIFYRNKQPLNSDILTSMSSVLSHRGLDGTTNLSESNIGLFHCMLHDTPESLLEKLPSRNSDKNLIITWHGRIDNREALKSQTGWRTPLSETTDSDLILAAFEKWGCNCTSHLLGDFSFAIWDISSQKMFCARDHMGIKPFYYILNDSIFAFASEIKSLLTLPEAIVTINNERVADYLTCIVSDTKSTFYNEIVRLPPGHSLEISHFKSHSSCYWSPKPGKYSFKNESEYEERFYSIFADSVRCRLRTTFPTGSLLSGGIDSSSIVCLAAGPLQQFTPAPLHTFSGVFDEIVKCDEKKYFVSIHKKYPTIPHFIHADRIHPGFAFDQVLQTEDEPFFGPHFFMLKTIMQLAQNSGVRILLDGHDGDSAVSHGNGIFTELLLSGKWFHLLQECYAIGNSPSVKRTLKFFLTVCWECFIYSTSNAMRLPLHKKQCNKLLLRLNPLFTNRTDIKKRLATTLSERSLTGRKELERHKRSITQPLHPYLLEFLERQGMQHNLICRYPFFDKRLIEFCLAIPPELKRSSGYNRRILRNSLRKILPINIRKRKSKTDFSDNLKHCFSTLGHTWLESNIDKVSEQIYNYISKSELEKSFNSFSNRPDKTSATEIDYMLRCISLAQWFRKTNGESDE